MVVRPSILWRAPLAGAVAAAGIAAPAPFSAWAADAGATITAKNVNGLLRIGVAWPDSMADHPPAIGAELDNNILIVRFDTPLNADVSDLAEKAPDFIRAARIDSNGKTLRIALKSEMKARVDSSYNIQAIDLTPPDYKGKFPGVDSSKAKKIREAAAAAKQRAAAAEAALLAAPPTVVDVSVGQAPNLTRIAFEWKKPVGYSVKTEKDGVRVRFNVRAKADIAEMRIDLPKYVKDVTQTTDARALEVLLKTQPNVSARHFRDGDYIVVDLTEAAPQSPDEALEAALDKQGVGQKAGAPAAGDPKALHPETEPSKAPEQQSPVEGAPAPDTGMALANPVPESGIVKVEGETSRRGAEFRVAFANPAAAAVFRRGKYIYAMFAADAQYDLRINKGDAASGLEVTPLRAPAGMSGLRIKAPDNLFVSATPDGARWTIRLTPQEGKAPEPVKLTADEGMSGIELKVALPGASALGAVIDPDTGARVDFAAALGQPCGVQRERRFIEALVLPTAHGAAFETYADDVRYALGENMVRMRRPVGLQITTLRTGLPTPSDKRTSPGFIDFAGWRAPADTPPFQHFQKLEALAAAAEPGTSAAARARMNMARAYLAYELAPEALGALDLALQEDPKLENSTAYRAMRGAASVIMGRMKDAEKEFSATASLSDPSTALWRGMVLLSKEDYPGARDAFLSGNSALAQYAPAWRAKFQVGAARASLGMGDISAAQTYMKAAFASGSSGETLDDVRLMQAKVKEAAGEADDAFNLLSELTKSPREPTAVKAAFELTRLGVERGKMNPAQAIDALEALRFRWRGDGIELETIRRLGALYASVGRVREGLGVMRAATVRFPDQPASRRMAMDMASIFDDLFIKGQADKLDPVMAVGLFYEFKDLTPVGADGDYMIRRLADRLVAFDLLPQAEQLLKHQVEHRLQGLAKAQVATELASIQLADRRPQDALITISSSRVARLPDELNRQRRLIQAAALADVGRFENAVELLDLDRSKEAERLRADVMWRAKDWPNAAAALLKLLPAAGKEALPSPQEDLVLRAAIALQFAEDEAGLAKLDKQYRAVMDLGARGSAFQMVTTGLDTSGVRLQELAARVAGDGLYDRFLERFRKRFEADQKDAAPKAQASAGAAAGSAAG